MLSKTLQNVSDTNGYLKMANDEDYIIVSLNEEYPIWEVIEIEENSQNCQQYLSENQPIKIYKNGKLFVTNNYKFFAGNEMTDDYIDEENLLSTFCWVTQSPDCYIGVEINGNSKVIYQNAY